MTEDHTKFSLVVVLLSVVKYGANWRTFNPNFKNKKHSPPPPSPPPKKNSLYLSKWNFPTLRLKHLVRFSHKNAFLIFPEMELWTFRFRHNLEKIKKTHPEKKFLVFLEIETSCSNIKNFLIYQETETLIFFLYSKKMKLSSSNIQYPCITELFCISGKVYSQH